MKVFKNFEEMYHHLKGDVIDIIPKEYVDGQEEPVEKPKKRGRKKKDDELLQAD